MRPKNVSILDWWLYNATFAIEHFIGLKLSNLIFKNTRRGIIDRVNNNSSITQEVPSFAISTLEYDCFEEFAKKNPTYFKTIAVFRGIANEWEAIQKWNKEFFRVKYGSTEVSIIDNKGLTDPSVDNKFEKTNFKEYFEDVESDQSKYLRFSRILDHNPQLLEDLDMSWLRKFNNGKKDGGTYMFIGEAGTKTPMHNAIAHTLFIQIEGDKKWTIYEPSDRMFLDAKAERFPYFRSDANPNHPNDLNHPLLKYAKKYEITLKKGDVLWMPSFYWHYVENLTPNIGVAYKFARPFQSFKISKTLTILSLLQTKPTLLSYFIYNKFKKQEYQFSKKTDK